MKRKKKPASNRRGHNKQGHADMTDTRIRDQVVDLIGEEGIAQAFAPIEDASGLPNAAYWSERWLALEQEHCFRRAWVFAGAEADLLC